MELLYSVPFLLFSFLFAQSLTLILVLAVSLPIFIGALTVMSSENLTSRLLSPSSGLIDIKENGN